MLTVNAEYKVTGSIEIQFGRMDESIQLAYFAASNAAFKASQLCFASPNNIFVFGA
jgi:hypothetical protein